MNILEILIGIGIVVVAHTIKKLFGKSKKRKQTCFVYCQKCGNELVSSNSFIEDKDGIVKYKCDKCGEVSFWDFIHYPIPYLRTCAGDCRHFYEDKCGHPDCTYGYCCSPDTMVKFEIRRKEKDYDETN